MANPIKHTSESVQAWTKYLFEEEIPELKRLVNLLPDNPIVVNIGAGNGTSGLVFMEARDDITLYTIDVRDKSHPGGCLEGERAVFRSAGFYHLLGERWFQIHEDSKIVGSNWKAGKIDMVFVDGDHSYIGVVGDIEIWMDHLELDTGIMSIHDYDKETACKDVDLTKAPKGTILNNVDRAVRELLLDEYPIVGQVRSLISFSRNH